MRGLRLNSEEFKKLAPQIDIIEVFNARVLAKPTNTKAENFARNTICPVPPAVMRIQLARLGMSLWN